MSLTISNLITELDKRIGDSSTDRISQAERFGYLTQGVVWLQERILNDHQVKKYQFDYFDTVNYYKTTTILNDLLEGNALNTTELKGNGQPFARKSAEELRAEIGYGAMESSYSIERRDGNSYLVINHDSKYRALIADSCESLTSPATWQVDSVNSDATNLTIDNEDFTEGSSCFNFDIDVSQSGNNRATIYTDDLPSEDLSDDADITSWLVDVKIPDTTETSSWTLRWGTDSSNYYSVSTTTDVNSNSFQSNNWITIKFDWSGASVTGTPDDSDISYLYLSVNYTGSQTDDTGYKVDNIRLVRPEKLDFHYSSWSVGTDTNGVDILKFTATSDIPYFSGQYDNYMFTVADYAASRAFKDLRLEKKAEESELDAEKGIARLKNVIPKSIKRETRSFKPLGVSFSGRRGFRI